MKAVPNRLLVCWAAPRRQHGALTLDDLALTPFVMHAGLHSLLATLPHPVTP